MTNPYETTDERVVQTFRRMHANSERTHVAILSAGESAYVAVAYDVDPVEFEPVDADIIAYDPTIDGVTQRAERWMETHARGVAGDDNGGSSGANRLKRWLSKLNDYGNQLVEQQQQDPQQVNNE